MIPHLAEASAKIQFQTVQSGGQSKVSLPPLCPSILETEMDMATFHNTEQKCVYILNKMLFIQGHTE